MSRAEPDDQQPSVRPAKDLAACGSELRVLAQIGDDPVEAREQRMVVGSHDRQYAQGLGTWPMRSTPIAA